MNWFFFNKISEKFEYNNAHNFRSYEGFLLHLRITKTHSNSQRSTIIHRDFKKNPMHILSTGNISNHGKIETEFQKNKLLTNFIYNMMNCGRIINTSCNEIKLRRNGIWLIPYQYFAV